MYIARGAGADAGRAVVDVEGRRNLTESAARNGRVWRREIPCVEDVEDLDPQLEREALGDSIVLKGGEIYLLRWRAGEGVARLIGVGSDGREERRPRD